MEALRSRVVAAGGAVDSFLSACTTVVLVPLDTSSIPARPAGFAYRVLLYDELLFSLRARTRLDLVCCLEKRVLASSAAVAAGGTEALGGRAGGLKRARARSQSPSDSQSQYSTEDSRYPRAALGLQDAPAIVRAGSSVAGAAAADAGGDGAEDSGSDDPMPVDDDTAALRWRIMAADSDDDFGGVELPARDLGRSDAHVEANKLQWACAKASCLSTIVNHNELITSRLEALLHSYEVQGDLWRPFAYKRAITFIKRLDRPLASGREALELSRRMHSKAIGKGIAEKIDEILGSGRLRVMEALADDPRVAALRSLTRVWGVGPVTARLLVERGVTSVEALRAHPQVDTLLNSAQRVGLRFVSDFEQRIPRSEVARTEALIRDLCVTHELLAPLGLQITAAGSFRRGKPTSGDMDILVVRPDSLPERGILRAVMHAMGNLLVGTLFVSDQTFYGAIRYPDIGVARRIDIKVYAASSAPFALMYFTGSQFFNRSLRHLAKKMGYSLDDIGIRKTLRGVCKGDFIPGLVTEKAIFDFFGIPFLAPNQRDL